VPASFFERRDTCRFAPIYGFVKTNLKFFRQFFSSKLSKVNPKTRLISCAKLPIDFFLLFWYNIYRKRGTAQKAAQPVKRQDEKLRQSVTKPRPNAAKANVNSL